MTILFIYGTLKTGRRRHFYLTRDGSKYLGEVRTAPRYCLYQLLMTDYPCMVETAQDGIAVEGELWEVSLQCLEALDAVEGTPTLFQRREITLEDGRNAEAYLMKEKPWLARKIGARFD
jgi:gamma-glutamylcyclotransferase (GGCT)/AIG2-like uncharacterized protein YtfP